jgi:hypothetical protein
MGAWTFVNPRFDNLIGVKVSAKLNNNGSVYYLHQQAAKDQRCTNYLNDTNRLNVSSKGLLSIVRNEFYIHLFSSYDTLVEKL